MPTPRKPVQLAAAASHKAKVEGHKAKAEDDGVQTPESAKKEEEGEQDKAEMAIFYNKPFNAYLIKALHVNKMRYPAGSGRRTLSE